MSKDTNIISQSAILENAEQHLNGINNNKTTVGLFEKLKANEAMQLALKQPDPVYLYPDLIPEAEFTICFGDPGAGKTLFCFNAANEIANDGNIVLYFDLELSMKQFQKRYTNDQGNYITFADTLFRIDYANLDEFPKDISYEDYFFSSLLQLVDQTNAKVIVIDNLTKVAAASTDQARDSIPMLEKLNKLKKKKQLTIIVLEHCRKSDPASQITLNHLQGSRMKANLCDNVFAIGKSGKNKNFRYIKQLKCRSGELVFDAENVKLFELSKDSGFLKFVHVGYTNEDEHLMSISGKEKQENIQLAMQMKEEGKSNVEIGKDLGVSEGTIRNWLRIRNS